jgi:hypothetical protein
VREARGCEVRVKLGGFTLLRPNTAAMSCCFSFWEIDMRKLMLGLATCLLFTSVAVSDGSVRYCQAPATISVESVKGLRDAPDNPTGPKEENTRQKFYRLAKTKIPGFAGITGMFGKPTIMLAPNSRLSNLANQAAIPFKVLRIPSTDLARMVSVIEKEFGVEYLISEKARKSNTVPVMSACYDYAHFYEWYLIVTNKIGIETRGKVKINFIATRSNEILLGVGNLNPETRAIILNFTKAHRIPEDVITLEKIGPFRVLGTNIR